MTDAVKDEIGRFLADARGSCLVAAVNGLLKYLKPHGRTYEQQIESQFVGCHPENGMASG